MFATCNLGAEKIDFSNFNFFEEKFYTALFSSMSRFRKTPGSWSEPSKITRKCIYEDIGVYRGIGQKSTQKVSGDSGNDA